MIVPMKHMTLLCVAGERERALEELHEMGVVHVNLAPDDAESDRLRAASAEIAALRHAQTILRDALAGKPVPPSAAVAHLTSSQKHTLIQLFKEPLPDKISGDIASRVRTIRSLAAARQTLVDVAARLTRELARYSPFGDFDAALLRKLSDEGVPVRLFRRPANTTFTPPDGAFVRVFSADKDFIYCALIGPGELSPVCETLEIPDISVSAMRGWREQALTRAARITELFKRAAARSHAFEREAARLAQEAEFAAAFAAMRERGAVAWLTGWVPAECERLLRDTAAERAWGLLLRDPADDESPPTLLRPPRLFRPMRALFEGLGIAPAYRESDVSVPFFSFFSIFFAMLVGDGGYGLVILLLTLWARGKYRGVKAASSFLTLMVVFSLATIVWGGLSNTWFGFHPAILDNAVSRWLSQPGGKGDSNMILVCFSLGVAHLSIARVWNAVALFPDTKFLAQIGWVGVIWFMFFTSCSVVGVLKMPGFMKPVLGVSVLLIAFFMLKKNELRANGADLGMLPLNIISCLGDIISYVRLFAVGLASVKVAENFNEMALGLNLPMIVKIPCVLLILLIGHGLNFAMAGLAVLVHAVRLNTLEFSNHKGVTWSGFAFKPFARNPDLS